MTAWPGRPRALRALRTHYFGRPFADWLWVGALTAAGLFLVLNTGAAILLTLAYATVALLLWETRDLLHHGAPRSEVSTILRAMWLANGRRKLFSQFWNFTRTRPSDRRAV